MKPYLKLLVRRESREMMGQRFVNVWLLILMLVATFVSIAFSEGSMNYLEDKMSDPFTNWVNISRMNDDNTTSDEDFNEFRDSLYDERNKQRFDYNDVLISMYEYFNMWGRNGGAYPISARFFQHLNSPLIHEVLKPGNIVEGCKVDTTLLDNETMGLIVSIGAIKRLGYDEKQLPAYINILKINEGADSLGFKLVASGNKYLPVSLPVLAVVKRLPGNVQMLSGIFLYEQLRNGAGTHPFDFTAHPDKYLRQLAFYVDDSRCEEFRKYVLSVVPDSTKTEILNANDYYHSMRSWKPGNIWQINFGDGATPTKVYQDVANTIVRQFPDQLQVCRVFLLNTGEAETPNSMYLSVEFRSLEKIGAFEAFAKEHKIQLEMEQVHSKQNFQEVARMARILSAAMLIFSIVCIIMFLVNMLQNYFQKVKRNIGTFKAFGMNGKELIRTYVLMLIVIVAIAIVAALLLTWTLQGLLPVAGLEKDGFNYLDLWNGSAIIAACIVLVSTVITVIFVMTRLLSQTPGDLIYDRN